MLENNHESMKTVVETFLTEETVDLIYDNEQLEKWNKHVEELGLTGQTQIVKKDKSPIPFMHLKNSHKNICSTLCPVKVRVQNYNITPIPVEILDLIALAQKENYFSKIEVWYDDENPDPFVIGVKGKWYSYQSGVSKDFDSEEEAKEYCKNDVNKSVYFKEWDATLYILGKWADVKRSWGELKEMAKTRFMESRANEYHKAIKEAKRGLEDLEIEAFEKFN